MSDPMDEAQAEMMRLEYELGYTAGHIAGVKAMYDVEHALTLPMPAPPRTPRWLAPTYWVCVALVVADSLWTLAIHDYTRVNAFEDGVMLMSVFSVWNSTRRLR